MKNENINTAGLTAGNSTVAETSIIGSPELYAINTAPEAWKANPHYEQVSDEYIDDPDVIGFYSAARVQEILDSIAPMMKTITHVAIQYEGKTYSLPAPNRHHHVIRQIGGIKGPDTQGFIDCSGAFLTRSDAMKLASVNGQLKRRSGGYQGPELYSEDLW